MSKLLFMSYSAVTDAWEVGGAELLDAYARYTKASDYQLITTDVIYIELQAGPNAPEIIAWLHANEVWPVATNEMEKYKTHLRDIGGLAFMLMQDVVSRRQ